MAFVYNGAGDQFRIEFSDSFLSSRIMYSQAPCDTNPSKQIWSQQEKKKNTIVAITYGVLLPLTYIYEQINGILLTAVFFPALVLIL